MDIRNFFGEPVPKKTRRSKEGTQNIPDSGGKDQRLHAIHNYVKVNPIDERALAKACSEVMALALAEIPFLLPPVDADATDELSTYQWTLSNSALLHIQAILRGYLRQIVELAREADKPIYNAEASLFMEEEKKKSRKRQSSHPFQKKTLSRKRRRAVRYLTADDIEPVVDYYETYCDIAANLNSRSSSPT